MQLAPPGKTALSLRKTHPDDDEKAGGVKPFPHFTTHPGGRNSRLGALGGQGRAPAADAVQVIKVSLMAPWLALALAP